MKLVKGPTEPIDPTYHLPCPRCKAVIEARRSELEHVSDQRDGDFYRLACLGCAKPFTIDCKVIAQFKREPSP